MNDVKISDISAFLIYLEENAVNKNDEYSYYFNWNLYTDGGSIECNHISSSVVSYDYDNECVKSFDELKENVIEYFKQNDITI